MLMRGVAYSFLFMRMLQLVCFFGLVFMYAHSPRIGSHVATLYISTHSPRKATHQATQSHAQPHQEQDAGQRSYQFNYKSSHSSENKRKPHSIYTQPTQGYYSVSPQYLHTYTTSPPQETIIINIIIVITIKHIHIGYIYIRYGNGLISNIG